MVVINVYPLHQGQATARPPHIRAYSMSMLAQYKPWLLYIPLTLVPSTAQTTIKAEPTAHNTTTSDLFVPKHGGSGEPALTLTEAVDR